MRDKAKRHKRLHPAISYAFLLGTGAISVTSAMSAAVQTASVPAPKAAAPIVAEPAAAPADLPSLKAAAEQFSVQLASVRAQANELSSRGYLPSPELADALGQGQQLTDMIARASSLADLGGIDAAARLQAIGARILANSKF